MYLYILFCLKLHLINIKIRDFVPVCSTAVAHSLETPVLEASPHHLAETISFLSLGTTFPIWY